MNEQHSISKETALQVNSILETFDAQIHNIISRYKGFETFKPKPTDVFIVSWMKSGTTLVQQLVYQLFAATGRVPGDPEGERFNDISEVVPFIEPRDIIGIREAINPYEPRVWKSHSTFDAFKGEEFRECKFIYCVRDGKRVAASFLDFTIDWIMKEPVEGVELRNAVYHKYFLHNFLGAKTLLDGTVQRRELCDMDISTWFTHIRGFKEASLENILFLIFEDAIEDIPTTVRCIAKFLSIQVTEEVVSLVAQKCARDAMAKDNRFNDTTISRMMGWDINGGVRVRPTDVPGFKDVKLPESSLDIYNGMLEEYFGVKEYSELAEQLRKQNSV